MRYTDTAYIDTTFLEEVETAKGCRSVISGLVFSQDCMYCSTAEVALI